MELSAHMVWHRVWHLMGTNIKWNQNCKYIHTLPLSLSHTRKYTPTEYITLIIINYNSNKYFIHADESARGDLNLSLFFSHILWASSISILHSGLTPVQLL